MAEINPFTVYFPEPNTIVKVVDKQKNTIEVSFNSNSGKSEGQELVRKLREKRSLENKDIVFNLDAAIETNSDRFNVEIDGKEVQIKTDWMGGKLEGLTEQHIQALFNNSQTHANEFYWCRRVRSQYREEVEKDNKKQKQETPERANAVKAVYKAYFPNALIGFSPEKLKRELPKYPNVEGYGIISDDCRQNLVNTGDYESITNLAKESGKAVHAFLKDILGLS